MSDEKDKKGAANTAPATDSTAELEKANAELSAKVAAQEKEIGELKKAAENAPDAETVKAQEKEIADLKKELEDAGKMVKDLKDRISASKGSKGHTVKVDGTTYLVVGGFTSNGKIYKAEDIAADEEIAKELIKKGSGLIKKVK